MEIFEENPRQNLGKVAHIAEKNLRISTNTNAQKNHKESL